VRETPKMDSLRPVRTVLTARTHGLAYGWYARLSFSTTVSRQKQHYGYTESHNSKECLLLEVLRTVRLLRNNYVIEMG